MEVSMYKLTIKKIYDEHIKQKQKEHLNDIQNNPTAWRPCMHEQCPDCVGTGIKKDGSVCIHGIACPCPKCTPQC